VLQLECLQRCFAEPTAVTSTSSSLPSARHRLALRLVVLDDEQAVEAAVDEAADLDEVSSRPSFEMGFARNATRRP